MGWQPGVVLSTTLNVRVVLRASGIAAAIGNLLWIDSRRLSGPIGTAGRHRKVGIGGAVRTRRLLVLGTQLRLPLPRVGRYLLVVYAKLVG